MVTCTPSAQTLILLHRPSDTPRPLPQHATDVGILSGCPHYDRARGNLDRHGVHFLTAYVAGA